MSDMTHTPGPWRYWTQRREPEDTCTFRNLEGAEILRAVTVTLTEADARLIAAAPDSMRALVRGYYCLADIHNQWPGRHLPAGQKLLCDMRDSIAKALGMSEEDVSNGAALDYGAS